jgi:hypothetical protein
MRLIRIIGLAVACSVLSITGALAITDCPERSQTCPYKSMGEDTDIQGERCDSYQSSKLWDETNDAPVETRCCDASNSSCNYSPYNGNARNLYVMRVRKYRCGTVGAWTCSVVTQNSVAAVSPVECCEP